MASHSVSSASNHTQPTEDNPMKFNRDKFTKQDIEREMAGTSAVFGRKHDVHIEFGGDSAYTDGKTIHYPSIPSGKTYTRDEMSAMRGYTDHETSHLTDSDFKVAGKAHRYMKREDMPITKDLTNGLEDMRCEALRIKQYAGCKHNLGALGDLTNRRFIESATASEEARAKCYDPLWIGPVATTFVGRMAYCPDTCREALALLPDEIVDIATRAVERAHKCKDTDQVFKLAKEVEKEFIALREKMREEYASEPESGPEPDDDGEVEGKEHEGGYPAPESGPDQDCFNPYDDDEGDDDDRGDGDADSVQGESEEADEGDGEGEGFSPEGGNEVERDDADKPARKLIHEVLEQGPEEKPYDPEVNKVIEEIIKPEMGSDWRPTGVYYQGEMCDHRYIFLDGREPLKEDIDHDYYNAVWGHYFNKLVKVTDYPVMVAETAGVTSVIRQRLSRAIMARERRGHETGLEQGRLDTRRLTSVMAGRTNVFKRAEDRVEINTSVMVLVDMSGSMAGTPSELANRCAITLMEALEPTGVQTACVGFTSSIRPYDFVVRGEKTKASKGFLNVNNTDMPVFKAFDRTLRACHRPMAGIEVLTKRLGCQNDDETAIQMACRMLDKQTTARKILLVLSDGRPQANEINSRALLKGTIHAVEDWESRGIETIGIGMRDDTVKHIYKNHVVVTDLHELAGTAMDKIAELLLGVRVSKVA